MIKISWLILRRVFYVLNDRKLGEIWKLLRLSSIFYVWDWVSRMIYNQASGLIIIIIN